MAEMTMMSRTDLPFLVSGRAQFNATLAASGFQPPLEVVSEVSPELLDLRENLRTSAGFSTLGIKTLSGVSPKNSALEQLARSVHGIHDADEQVMAVDEILSESNKLYPDQNAYVISKIIQTLLPNGAVTLQERAASRVGQRILRAGMSVAPELVSVNIVNDTGPLDLLKEAMVPFSKCPTFHFNPNTPSSLEESGLLEPMSAQMHGRIGDSSPQGLASWVRNQIENLVLRQINPQDLGLIMDHAVSLPDELRGRSLALLVNTFWNATQNAHNEALILEVGQLIDELPFKLRITALEAYYNQLSLLPNEIARAFFPLVSRSINRLPSTQDFRFNRSRSDLVSNLNKQGAILDQADFFPGESLVQYDQRAHETAIKEKRFGWAA